jgi:hypothetical protein
LQHCHATGGAQNLGARNRGVWQCVTGVGSDGTVIAETAAAG